MIQAQGKMKHARIPNRLKRFRKERGLTQKQVASILGLKSSSIISRWEKGVLLPKTLNVLKLAVLYRTMVDALFSGLRQVVRDEIGKREKAILRGKIK